MITRIRVPSRWHNPGDEITMAHKQHAVADFTLGIGSCGKLVEQLDVSFERHGVQVVQYCSDNEQKTFVYPWHTVTGRVEVTYK